MKKSDLYLVVIVIVLASIAAAIMFFLRPQTQGAYVLVTIGGTEAGKYSLYQDRVETIITGANGDKSNVLEIKGKKVQITAADCPDKVCVKHVPISVTNQHIVCLPNQLMVEIIGETIEEAEYDYIAR